MKHISNLECKLCGEKLTTGWCKTKIGRYFKRKLLIHRHLREKHNMKFIDIILK